MSNLSSASLETPTPMFMQLTLLALGFFPIVVEVHVGSAVTTRQTSWCSGLTSRYSETVSSFVTEQNQTQA